MTFSEDVFHMTTFVLNFYFVEIWNESHVRSVRTNPGKCKDSDHRMAKAGFELLTFALKENHLNL